MREYKNKKKEFKGRLLQAFMAAAVFIAFVIFAGGIAAQAATGSVSVEEINYDNSTLTIRMSSADHMIFLSNATQKKWEYIPAQINDCGSYKLAVMDISWVSLSTNYVMSFKADVSAEAIKVTIPKRDNSLKVSYNMFNGTMNFTNAGTKAIEWKKRDSMEWTDYNESMFGAQLAAFIDNGASLMFRVKGVNGSGSNAGSRPGKEVTVTIPKKSAAPAITVDDAKMTVALKKGMSYRYVDADGYALSDWNDVTADRNEALSDIAAQAMYNTETGTAGEDVYIQFYKKATASSQMSKYKTIKIPAQPCLTSADLDTANNSLLEYTSSSSFKMTFKTAGENNILEYCIITKSMQDYGITIKDLAKNDLVWTAVSSQTPITKTKETESKLTDGSLIYYRKKAVKSLGEEGYAVASPVALLGTVSYPKGAITESFTLLRSIEGMCKGGSNTLSFSFYSDTKGDISAIRFLTNGGTDMGSATFTVTINENGPEPSKKYIYNVTLTDLSEITCTRTKLYAYIYFANEPTSDPTKASIRSNDEGGIGLYLYPKSVVNNPSTELARSNAATKLAAEGYDSWSNYNAHDDKIGFTSAIKRVYMSTRNAEALAAHLITAELLDQTDFRVKVDIGTLYVPELNEGEKEIYTGEKVKVRSIKYDGIEMDGDPYFGVEYYEDEDASGNKYRAAVITFHVDEIEKHSAIDDRDKDTPVYIYLDNGEVITTGLTMNLQRTAVARNTSFTFTSGSLEAWIITKTTDKEGVVTETKERNVDAYYSITLTIPANLGGKNDYEVGVKSVTWNDINILYSTQNPTDNTIKVILDSDILNRIPGISTSVTYPIRIEFTNGYVITSGIPMTINPANGN